MHQTRTRNTPTRVLQAKKLRERRLPYDKVSIMGRGGATVLPGEKASA